MTGERKINFSAGPATLDPEILIQARDDMLSYKDSGMSVMEMSHRGADFSAIIAKAEADLRALWNIPDNYYVLFQQGGATSQFAAVPMNLIGEEGAHVDYIVSGNWSKKAADEAKKYATVNQVIPKQEGYTGLPAQSEWKFDPKAKYVYYCANETVFGVEVNDVPETNGVPLVCDMSSNFLSKPVDVSKYALIYGGAQKNIGMAGVTVVIVRKDLVDNGSPLRYTPAMLDYAVQAKGKSMYNTPPTYAIYTTGLVFQWLLKQGGLDAIEERNKEKAKALYAAIDESNGFYTCPVDPLYRSRMNVPFRIKAGNEELEALFIKEAANANMVSLKGHRSVGGIRASIYNAMTKANVDLLVAFMHTFKEKNL